MSPHRARLVHGILAFFWFVQMCSVPLFVNGWKLYLLEISLWANFATHLAGLSAERPSEIVSG